jgi:transcriptional regulator with XRE-family HTH domain
VVVGIGKRLRKARKLAQISARELDRLAGRTPGHAGLIEHRPGADVMAGTVLAYADVLGLSLDWLIAGRGAEPIAARVQAAVVEARAQRAA